MTIYGTVKRYMSEFRGYNVPMRPQPVVGEIVRVTPEIRGRLPWSEWTGDPADDNTMVTVAAFRNDYYMVCEKQDLPRGIIKSVGNIQEIRMGVNGWLVTIEIIDQPMLIDDAGQARPMAPDEII